MTVNEIRNRISRLQTDAYWEKRHYGSVSERTTEKIKALQEELAFMKDKNAKIRAQKARTRRGEQQTETYARNLETKRFRLNTNVVRDPITGRFVSWDDEIYGLVYDDETIAWYEEDAFAAEAHSRWIATCVVSGSDGLSDAAIAYQELLNLKDAMLPTAFDELVQPELYNENHVDDLAYADELEVEKKLMESFDAEVQWNVYESVELEAELAQMETWDAETQWNAYESLIDDEPESDFDEYDEPEDESPAYDEEQVYDVFRTDNPWDDDGYAYDPWEDTQEYFDRTKKRDASMSYKYLKGSKNDTYDRHYYGKMGHKWQRTAEDGKVTNGHSFAPWKECSRARKQWQRHVHRLHAHGITEEHLRQADKTYERFVLNIWQGIRAHDLQQDVILRVTRRELIAA